MDSDTKSVSDRLAAIAEKFLGIAEQTQDTRQAGRALSVVNSALQLSAKIKAGLVTDYALAFLSRISFKILRSDLFTLYTQFCKINDFPCFTKSEFFAFCRQQDFVQKLSGGSYYFEPPFSWPPTELKVDLDFMAFPALPEPIRTRRKSIYGAKKPDSE